MQTLSFLWLLLCPAVFALNNGVGLTPPMGWNSWNKFACNIQESLIKQTADVIVASGLKDAGYEYVNLDDCWQVSRDADNKILVDEKLFPSGIKGLADYVHSKGLKFGLYSDAGFKTCAGRPGSIGLEKVDAEVWASWGVDYVKYDNCNDDGTKPAIRYPPMRDALNTTGRPIFFSMCEWGVDEPWQWAADVGNSWRTTGDISDNFESVLSILDQQVGLSKYAGPGHWNDPDMLEVGNGGLNDAENRAHFSLWALLKSPLLIGCDITNLSDDVKAILTNREVIELNQDLLGVQGDLIKRTGSMDVWATILQDGRRGVVFFNRGAAAASISIDMHSIGLSARKPHKVRNLWTHADLGEVLGSFTATVAPHDVVVVSITPAAGEPHLEWRPAAPLPEQMEATRKRRAQASRNMSKLSELKSMRQ